MKKLIAVVLALVMVFALCACGSSSAPAQSASAPAEEAAAADAAPIKVGLVALHDENSTYDKNFIDAFKAACDACGVEGLIKTQIPEEAAAYDAACEFADDGCALVFADSYGHQSYILDAAKEYPEVQFVSCTGDTALNDGVANFHNAFASIFQGRYIAGVAAGLKLKEMIDAGEFTASEAKVGYVGAMTYAEVKSGYTSWFLGVRSIVPEATMEVVFTGSWYDETLEKEGAQKLIANGCKLISQHADSWGAPTACEEAGVPNVSYNGSTISACPNTFIISSRIDWTPYFTYAIKAVQAGEAFDTDWCGNLETGSVALTDVNEAVAAEGTAEKLAEVKAAILDGSLKVFDCSTWTKDGKNLSSYTDSWGLNGAEAIENGVFTESTLRSAPYFDIDIDGITLLG
ncbi:MAG: BMP family ABC transporter substrate-binding protein [Bacteroidales bacterium]|nr:BMP family ABC transporter substrate-binding protein [Candidatus Equibacterium intestinale]